MRSRDFLLQKFREFYSKTRVEFPSFPESREFGIGDFGKKITERHLSFSSLNEFNSFLSSRVPFFVSYSAAYYKFPSKRPMQAKELTKADLVYEFDADDLKTECKERHDSWKCKGCNAEGKGNIKKCPKCGESVLVEEWVCNECLDAVKKEVFRLINFLENDFGFSGVELNFSGSKGYHIHLRTDDVLGLSHPARIELLDYLTAVNLDSAALGFCASEKKMLCPRPGNAIGWQKKILVNLIDLFKQEEPEKIASVSGISLPEAKEFLSDVDYIINEINKGVLAPLPRRGLEKTKRFWESIIGFVVDSLKLGIDRQTSVDIYKIIRVPETIHGGTGLVAKSFGLDELASFKPLKDSVVFSGNPVKVKLNPTPKFYLNGRFFGPFEEGVFELPEFAAVFLLARGNAIETVI